MEGLVNLAARLEPAGEEGALPQLWDGHAEVAHLSGEQQLAVAFAVDGPLIRTVFMASGSNSSGDLGLQQILEARRTISGIRALAVVTSMSWPSSMAPLWVRVMICVRFGSTAPNRVTDKPTHCHSRCLREPSHQPRLRRG